MDTPIYDDVVVDLQIDPEGIAPMHDFRVEQILAATAPPFAK